MALNRMERAALIEAARSICRARGGAFARSILRPLQRHGGVPTEWAGISDTALLAIHAQWGGITNPPQGIHAV